LQIGRFYRVSIGVLLVLLIAYMLYQDQFLFHPVVTGFQVVFLPLLLSTFFYYLLRPFVRRLHAWKVPKSLGILLLYLLMAGVWVLFFLLIWPILQDQIVGLIDNFPQVVHEFQNQLNHIESSGWLSKLNLTQSDLMNRASSILSQAVSSAGSYLSNAFSFFSDMVIVISTVPIVLYYMLKDDERAYRKLVDFFPKRIRGSAVELIREIDTVLHEFILGRVLLCSLLGLIVLIGFLIIGLPYALLLAILVGLFNMIPYVGSIIGAIPCVIVAFIYDPPSVIWVILIILLAQQIEGNFLSPHVYGRTLDIHPMTTILLLLVAGTIGGIIGMLIAIPVYLIARIIVSKFYKRPAEE
jgi:predicted PurR-regulated permease PerM